MSDDSTNAKIRTVSIKLERGFFYNISLDLDYGNAGQSLGGYCLGKKGTKPNALLAVWIQGLMEVFEVEAWDDLIGLPCRVKATHSRVESIGHFMKDRWFTPEEAMKNMGVE